MPDNITPSSTTTERTVVVTDRHLSRLWTLTIASLCLNGLILLLILLCAIAHHRHHKKHEHGGRDGYSEQGFRGGHHRHFHHFGREGMGGGWGHRGGFGGGEFGKEHQGGRGFDRGRGGEDHGGMGKGWGERRGEGKMGMMGMGPKGPATPPDPAKMTDRMLDHLTKQLTLTDDQKAKIKPIVEAQIAQMQKDMQAQRQAHEKALQDTKAKIKAILTPDQQKQLDTLPTPGQKPADETKPAEPAKNET